MKFSYSRLAFAAIFSIATMSGTWSKAAEQIHLRVTTANTYIKPIYEQIAKNFMAENPDIVVSIEVPTESWDDQVQRTLLDGLTGSMPDVTEEGLNRFQSIADRGFAIPIDPMISHEADFQSLGYDQRLLDLTSYKGQHWGLPFRMATPILYFNADLIRKAGGDPGNLPTTWSGIITLANHITKLGDGNMGMFIEYDADGAWMFLTLLNLEGGAAMRSDNKTVAFDGPEGLRALELVQDIGKSGMIDMPRAQARQSFSAGKIGFLISAGSQIASYQKQSSGKFTLGTAPLPRPSVDSRVPVGGGLLMIHSTDTKKQAAAWKFIKFATGPAAQTILVEKTGMMPSNDIPAARSDLLGQFYRNNPLHRANLEQLPFVTGWYTFPAPNSVKITDKIRNIMRSVVTNETTPKSAIDKMKTDVESLLSPGGQ